ncbi:hypothetical protein EI77_01594 [Prosthecobacter fusiformis]|uniref:DUF1365 family protein n=1 Tax=Prosthecobacter fusiformis TaxID=48464 RepID=A0A4R7S634_9BACT|nr:DUF1365 domain-containing protein [Prosthecobacter fusiformis]TDU73126.1 hypothetical protein EI77_01594 [Prosthecobacter fusiformis]
MVNAASAIYECEVMHHRLKPKVHRFSYRLFYLWLDLDELDELSNHLRFFKRNRWALFSFYDEDHIVRDAKETKANVLQTIQEAGVDASIIAKVKLLTFPRVMGYIFNPVCFYYCYDAQGQPVCSVAEVTNTFHEQKPYVLTRHEGDRFRLTTPKHFYVSPFFGLELNFDFKLRLPTEHLEIHVDDREGGERVMLTSLTGHRRPLTDSALLACAFKYPLLTLRVIFLIHWHALRLWMKGLRVHRKADQPDLQRGVFRPHRSISPIKP